MWIIIFSTIFFSQATKTPVKSTKSKKPTVEEVSLTPGQTLSKASQEALGGNHREVIRLLRPLLFPASKFTSEEQEIQGLRLLGLAFWFIKDFDSATQTFSMLLTRRPDFTLDPVVVASGAIDFFNNVKKKLKEKLTEINRLKQAEEIKRKKQEEEAARKKMEELKKAAPVLRQTVTINKNFYIFNLFPLGLGQFQNEHKIKGWIFAGGQALSGLISLGAYSYLRYKYPVNKVPKDQLSSAEQMVYLQVGAGAVFFGLWIVSIVDSVINYKDTRQSIENKFIPGNSLNINVQMVPGGGIIGLSGGF